MNHVFVSYSGVDRERVDQAAAILRDLTGDQVFLAHDPEVGIPGGARWYRDLYIRLRGSCALVVLCSPASMTSRWCFAEVFVAKGLDLPIIPVRLDPCELLPGLDEHQVIEWGDDLEARLDRGLRAAGVDPTSLFRLPAGEEPYQGLEALDVEHAAVFAGRDDELAAALEVVRGARRMRSGHRLLIVGASGTGKSSFLRAGLVARLRHERGFFAIDPFRLHGDPWVQLLVAAHRALARAGWAHPKDELQRRLGASASVDGVKALVGLARQVSKQPEATLIVPLDQLEEALAVNGSVTGEGFVRLLEGALEGDTEGPMGILIATVRSDYLASLQKVGLFSDGVVHARMLARMRPLQLRQVIRIPAQRAGEAMPDDLTDRLVDATGEDDALPLLAFVLRRLWDQRRAGGLTVAAYDQLGGFDRALELLVSQVMVRVSADTDAAVATAFRQLATLNAAGNFVRRQAAWSELPAAATELLEAFVAQRLLVAHGDGQARVFEVSHEALFRVWKRLGDWLESERPRYEAHRDLAAATADWVHHLRSGDYLLRGRRLAAARALRAQPLHALSVHEQTLVDESTREDARGRTKTHRAIAIVAGIVLVLGGAAALMVRKEVAKKDAAKAKAEREGFAEKEKADRQRLADEARSEAQRLAQASQEGGRQHRLLVALESVHATSSRGQPLVAESDTALRDALPTEHSVPIPVAAFSPAAAILLPRSHRVVLFDIGARIVDIDRPPPIVATVDGPQFMSGAAVDDDRFLLGGGDGTLYLFDADGRELHRWKDHEHAIQYVVASADRKVVVTSSSDATVVRTGEGTPTHRLEGSMYRPTLVPDGRLVVGDARIARSGLARGRLRLHDLRDGRAAPIELRDDALAVSAPIDCQGTRCAILSQDVVRVVDLGARGSRPTERVKIDEPFARDIALSPDGSTVAILGQQLTLASVTGGARRVEALTPSGLMIGDDHARFDDDGTLVLLTATGVVLWSEARWRAALADPTRTTLGALRVLDLHRDEGRVGATALFVARLADGRVVTSALGGEVRVWNGRGLPSMLEGEVGSQGLSADRKMVVALRRKPNEVGEVREVVAYSLADGASRVIGEPASFRQVVIGGPHVLAVTRREGVAVAPLDGSGSWTWLRTESPPVPTLTKDATSEQLHLYMKAQIRPVIALSGDGTLAAIGLPDGRVETFDFDGMTWKQGRTARAPDCGNQPRYLNSLSVQQLDVAHDYLVALRAADGLHVWRAPFDGSPLSMCDVGEHFERHGEHVLVKSSNELSLRRLDGSGAPESIGNLGGGGGAMRVTPTRRIVAGYDLQEREIRANVNGRVKVYQGFDGIGWNIVISDDGSALAALSGARSRVVRLAPDGELTGVTSLPLEKTGGVVVGFTANTQDVIVSDDVANRTWIHPLEIEPIALAACEVVGRNLTCTEWCGLFPSGGRPYHRTCEQWPDGRTDRSAGARGRTRACCE